ncbi:MAG: hypothetical protein HFACDABA_01134 [Anaerolineales bacterium]|nr:hypothetical protein [Anaerolineales bacterium]
MKTSIFLERLLLRTRGRFLLAATFLAQLLSIPGGMLGMLVIQLNANFSQTQLQNLTRLALPVSLLGNLGLLLISWYLTPNARSLLDTRLRDGHEAENAEKSLAAWREISAYPWRYGIITLPLTFIVNALAPTLYFYLRNHIILDQLVYSLIGGLVTVLVVVILTIILLERMLLPARVILLPREADSQITGLAGAPVGWKLSLITMALVGIGIMLVAPIGYRQIVQSTINIFDPEQIVRNMQIRRDMQIQSIIAGAAAILLNLGLVYAISRTFTNPISSLIETFKEVEGGNLGRRVNVTATDEIGTLTIQFNRMIARLETLQTGLEEQVRERTKQLEAINEVGRAASAILDPAELIERVVNLITDEFGYYYAALFLLDPSGHWAELRSATGEAGRVLRESRHRLEVGGKSMVGSAIQQRRARIALDVGAEPARFNNPLLPYTRSEIALPLVAGERILGALDVQSTTPSAFNTRDIETLQNMANQVAVAIENAHLFQETRQRLEELQAAQRQYLREAWTSLAVHEHNEYIVGDVITEKDTRLDVPLTLRDQIIGEISLSGDSSWTSEERSWVEAVATQAAIALENARLLDQSQKNAAYEKLIADITGKIWASTTIEGILQVSVRELGRTLNATEAIIALDPGEEP